MFDYIQGYWNKDIPKTIFVVDDVTTYLKLLDGVTEYGGDFFALFNRTAALIPRYCAKLHPVSKLAITLATTVVEPTSEEVRAIQRLGKHVDDRFEASDAHTEQVAYAIQETSIQLAYDTEVEKVVENLDPTMKLFLQNPMKNNDSLVYFESMCRTFNPIPAFRALNRYAVTNCKTSTVTAADAVLIDRCFGEIERRVENSGLGSHFMGRIKQEYVIYFLKMSSENRSNAIDRLLEAATGLGWYSAEEAAQWLKSYAWKNGLLNDPADNTCMLDIVAKETDYGRAPIFGKSELFRQTGIKLVTHAEFCLNLTVSDVSVKEKLFKEAVGYASGIPAFISTFVDRMLGPYLVDSDWPTVQRKRFTPVLSVNRTIQRSFWPDGVTLGVIREVQSDLPHANNTAYRETADRVYKRLKQCGHETYERQIFLADSAMDDGWTLVDCPFDTCANKTNYHQASFYATQFVRHNRHAEMKRAAEWISQRHLKIRQAIENNCGSSLPDLKKELEKVCGPLTLNDGNHYRSLHMFYDSAFGTADVTKYVYARVIAEEETFFPYARIRVRCHHLKNYDYLLLFAL